MYSMLPVIFLPSYCMSWMRNLISPVVGFDSDIQPATDKYKHDGRKAQNFSGPLMLPNRASANSLSAPMRSSGGCKGYST